MSDIVFYFCLAITVVIIIYIEKFLIYKYTGWIDFTMRYGENFKVSLSPEKVKDIIFNNCIYTVITTDNKVYTRNVTSQLNYMINAYQNNVNSNYEFKLEDDGLSQYSFVINGLTDICLPNVNNNVCTSSSDTLNNTQNVTLTGSYKLK